MKYEITGMSCGGCVSSVKEALLKLPEMQEAEVKLNPQRAILTMIKTIDVAELQAQLNKVGRYTIKETIINKHEHMKECYGTLSQTINGLKKEGYTLDFNVQQEFIVSNTTKAKLSPKVFEIDKVYRFEGESNPDDQSVLYAISSSKLGVKGVLVNGYGISADDATNAFIAKLDTHPDITG